MLQLLFAVAFSAVPLTLYVPPVRTLNLFLATMQDLFRDSSFRTAARFLPRLRYAFSRLFDCILCNNTP